MTDLVNISVSNAAITAVLGYLVVFFGIVLLLGVIVLSGKILSPKKQPVTVQPEAVEEEPAPLAPGSAGELKLYDTDPRDAAMIMAIVADTLGKPLNELRFISIREVTENEV